MYRLGVMLAVGAGVAILLVAADHYLPRFTCGNEILAQVPSPGGSRRVVVFERDCGATTGFSTQASLLPKGTALPNESGNLFVADTNHGAAPPGPGGGPALRSHGKMTDRWS